MISRVRDDAMKKFRFEALDTVGVQNMYRVSVKVRTRLGLRLGIGLGLKFCI